MTQSVTHRGPDGFGYIVLDSSTGYFQAAHQVSLMDQSFKGSHDIGLGHRRLAIIDISEAADQPMRNPSGSLWITYNGEIYNYLELRQELQAKGRRFMSSSDTEVVLQAYEEWGIGCLERFHGMFAFGIWDQKKKFLFCARDRFGMKPFYFFNDSSWFLFASEIKQLFHFPGLHKEINNPLVYDYLVHGLIDHTSQTLFRNIHQLEPGQYLIVGPEKSSVPEIHRYWQLKENNPEYASCSDTEYPVIFHDLFSDSVHKHLRSDVPVGSCLSGGIDSSSIVCTINTLLKEKPNPARQLTFTSCFDDRASDEREYAEAVTQATHAENIKAFPDMNRVMDETGRMLDFHDEPFLSTSQYAQWCLFQKIQQSGIKVVLDGQGADEILGGYHSCYGAYFVELFTRFRWIRFFREANWYRSFQGGGFYRPFRLFASALSIHYFGMRLGFMRGAPSWINKDFHEDSKSRIEDTPFRFSMNPFTNFLALMIPYNLNALLKFEDRSSMAHSVEARLPFLDHRLVEFLFTVPSDQKIRNGWTKYILREALQDVLPGKIRNRKDKMGFVTPESKWFAALPESTICDLIRSQRVKDSGCLDVDQACRAVKAIASGHKPFNFRAWRILNFCQWLERIEIST